MAPAISSSRSAACTRPWAFAASAVPRHQPQQPAHGKSRGNAIVDVLAHAEDAFLIRHELSKGAMTLIDEGRAEALYGAMGPGVEVSGGSAANTAVGLAELGARATFIGKVRDDQLGQIFGHDIRAAGVAFATPPANAGPSTARCLIFVTPDAQRTMQTYLGACTGLTTADIDEKAVKAARITYLEGYLWDPPAAKAAFRKAAEIARAAGRKVALTLSDPFCVERHRADFRALIEGSVDILFANEAEIRSLWQVGSFKAALAATRGRVPIAALTRSAAGSVVLDGETVHEIAAEPVERVVDTTGAGDLYAAGFLHGLVRGAGHQNAGPAGRAWPRPK